MDEKSGMSQYSTPPPPPGYSTGYSTGYPPAYSATSTMTQPTFAPPGMGFREVPVQCRCTKCGADIMTSTMYEAGALTWLICVITALIGLWLGCCLIPFCVDACKDVVHSCPNCKQVVGIYRRLS